MRRWPYILVVDDDADFRDGLRLALEMKGYQVEGAANGKEALDRIEQKPPLLSLLDTMERRIFEPEELERTIATLLRPRLVTVRSAPTSEKQR